MKILHTSDFHLGKSLEGFSRLDEQKKFLDFFISKASKMSADIIIIAGDIYDSPNPPAIAEEYFYDFLKNLSDKTNSAIIIIPGNHDSPKRLAGIRPLAKSHGIIIYENHDDSFTTGFYKNVEILSSENGVIKLKINNNVVNIIALPYISEVRLNKSIFNLSQGDDKNALSFEEKLSGIINPKLSYISNNEYNILIAHLFTLNSKIDDSKTGYSLGGAYIVNCSILPADKLDYIALGHLHKHQAAGDTGKIFYSGSPIHYNKSETKTEEKSFLCVDIDEEKKLSVQKVNIPVFKKIDIWYANSPAEAIQMSKDKKDEESFVYLNVKTDTPLSSLDIRQIKSYKKDIVEIRPILSTKKFISIKDNMLEKTEEQKFIEFYKDRYNTEPDDNLIKRYMEILLH